MKNSPFIYGTTVSKTGFINRKDEIRKLSGNLTGGINTTIISPRRWGKSSLVEKTVSLIAGSQKSLRIVSIDLFTVSSSEQFLEKFAREVIRASSSRWQDWIKSAGTFFKMIVPKINVGADPENDFSISFDWNELKKNEDEIINLAETVSVRKGIKMIICLDEFQNIANFDDFEAFEKKLRAIWQRQKNTTYCIYGSKRHMMSDIFNNPSKPFYRFGDIMLLDKIGEKEWVKFITSGFRKSGKTISSENAAIIASLMQNHSWYVQQLSHYTWNLTSLVADRQIIEAALKELINANTPFYQAETESLSLTQVNLLIAVANQETQLTSVEVMNKYRLGTPRNVSKNRDILVNNDIIQRVSRSYEFVDPAFELWFRQNFLNQNMY
ncbi:MAG: ATP-binding protein [Bacteroidia bacterium]|nr:MAG: ATP-binding protein [Bacteroidia bacterium]